MICWFTVVVAVALPLVVYGPPTNGAEEDAVEAAAFLLFLAAALCFGITYALYLVHRRKFHNGRR